MTPTVGPLGRLGFWTASHIRIVVIGWAVIAIGLGVFAPRAEHALSGAGWEASGSESVAAREQIESSFGGQGAYALMVVVHGDGDLDPALARVASILDGDPRVASVSKPQISEDGRTAIVQGGAAARPTEMVRAADELKDDLADAGDDRVTVSLTGAPGMWSDFNEANKSAMLKSELISWPVTLAILMLAFGSLVAAGLPLLLTILGLMASAGSLFLISQVFDVSIWAMNFALMFALALGIDYALFIVARFRGAHFGSDISTRDAVAMTMDTAGKAVLFSGVTVLISLSAVMLVPSPAFRSMALGIMLSVAFVLLAALTLLPAVLAWLGDRVDKLALPWVHAGEHRSPAFARWAEILWRRPWAFGLSSLAILVALALPAIGLETGMPSIKVVPESDSSRQGYTQVQDAFGPGAPGTLQVVVPGMQGEETSQALAADPGIANVTLGITSETGEIALFLATPTDDPSNPDVGATIDRLRTSLPSEALVGGAAAENHDLEEALAGRTLLVFGVVLALGFLLLLVALQAPIIAAVGVMANLLATAAAFGIARLIFQDGRLESLLGFESQGFLNAWGPVFFFAMIFAISMDYTVFLLASAKEHYDLSGDPREAMIGGLAHSGRTIFAAAGVMVAVFFTFALSGPLPPKEMGVILGVAVLLDAMLVRLVLMPVLLRVLGRYAWAQPQWLDRILPDVRFGHS
ncbi:MAG: MMPL family transporter [Thermoleophilia bacterium]|nr:MMPL family transporter [Thermoleophilia bacterium]MDH5280817.1 MMPL family transporter [Thermoleophilia bacterium]